MLFNSFAFLLVFLPVVLAVQGLVERFWPEGRAAALLLLSFVFYGYWDWRFLPLLAGSILVNWLLAEAFRRSGRRAIVTLAIVADLLLLGLFKYFDFFADLLPGHPVPDLDVVLPLGISFFTFHHVMYLTDLGAGRAPPVGLLRYALYIAFFPQVLAGPLVRWSEVLHQFDPRGARDPDADERLARGAMLLVVGLVKKVFVGDPLAAYVNPAFHLAAEGKLVGVREAWQATIGFSLQIYFDFSGYTDMALGLALLFGIVLPQNFDRPYLATSLQDFWRRWHMTLSRFLRDYLYIPLGGSRNGMAVRLAALFATMSLGGLWHGAGLTFVAWGMLHGAGLGGGVLWRRAGLRMPAPLGWVATMAFVILCWVLFRATSFDAALRIYAALFGFAPLGPGLKWRALAIAAALALVGPTAWAAVHRLPPRRSVAAGFGLVLVLALLELGNDGNYDFIYFQF